MMPSKSVLAERLARAAVNVVQEFVKNGRAPQLDVADFRGVFAVLLDNSGSIEPPAGGMHMHQWMQWLADNGANIYFLQTRVEWLEAEVKKLRERLP